MLSGSVAMSLYIVPRATRDFDFYHSFAGKDVDVFAEDFKEGYYLLQKYKKNDTVSIDLKRMFI
jgi:hypothetical protein